MLQGCGKFPVRIRGQQADHQSTTLETAEGSRRRGLNTQKDVGLGPDGRITRIDQLRTLLRISGIEITGRCAGATLYGDVAAKGNKFLDRIGGRSDPGFPRRRLHRYQNSGQGGYIYSSVRGYEVASWQSVR